MHDSAMITGSPKPSHLPSRTLLRATASSSTPRSATRKDGAGPSHSGVRLLWGWAWAAWMLSMKCRAWSRNCADAGSMPLRALSTVLASLCMGNACKQVVTQSMAAICVRYRAKKAAVLLVLKCPEIGAPHLVATLKPFIANVKKERTNFLERSRRREGGRLSGGRRLLQTVTSCNNNQDSLCAYVLGNYVGTRLP